WMSYNIIQTVKKNYLRQLVGLDSFLYDIEKVLAVVPIPPHLQPADVFLSYSSQDRKAVEKLAAWVKESRHTVWFDKELINSQQFRDIINQHLKTTRAIVIL